MRITKWMFTASLLAAMTAAAQTEAKPASAPAAQPSTAQGPVTTLDQVIDRSIERERALIQLLRERTPLVETYLQDLRPDPKLGPTPTADHYFFGRLDLASDQGRRDFLSKGSLQSRLLGGFTNAFKLQYKPMGFSWMIFVDRDNYDRAHYDFSYIRREFLGDVRCIVFDVTPKKGAGNGRFHGRIWVEDQDYNIVRLNGTYEPHPKNAFFFHMDSWRLNLTAGYWVPAYIYSEEGDFGYDSKDKIAFKAQTRIWGYNLKGNGKEDELTTLKVDASVNDQSAAAQDASPLEAEHQWQQQAEDNVVDRLERAGLLAPSGELDKVLQTVVANLEITNNLELSRPVRTRVMLTSPLETFSVGNTIVISRGLVDVLPDEASLAAVLSHELAHIALGHNLGSKYAFNDRMLFSDESSYENLGFRHIPEEEASADAKAVEYLQHSPYSQKLGTPGLFFKQLAERSKSLQGLLTAHLGNSLVDKEGNVQRLTAVMNQAPALDINKLDQIAALPLGGRVKLNPWDNRVEMSKTAPIGINSARDKMPLEVTPFYPRLTRLGAAPTGEPTTAANTAKPATTTSFLELK
jgi:hypothetical protein